MGAALPGAQLLQLPAPTSNPSLFLSSFTVSSLHRRLAERDLAPAHSTSELCVAHRLQPRSTCLPPAAPAAAAAWCRSWMSGTITSAGVKFLSYGVRLLYLQR